MEFLNEHVVPYFNYWVYVILLMIGMRAMITKNNLIKKLIGMSIFQTAIILLYVSIGTKSDSTIPILEEKDESAKAALTQTAESPQTSGDKSKGTDSGSGAEGENKKKEKPSKYAKAQPDRFANPLPHVLMLTAIVVGVSTLGVALAISQAIFREFGSLEEDEILTKIKQGGAGGDV